MNKNLLQPKDINKLPPTDTQTDNAVTKVIDGKVIDVPAPPIDIKDVYTLYYRKGQNTFPMIKHFIFKGRPGNSNHDNLLKAIDFCRQHCEMITARFLRCEPFIADFTREEERVREE